LYRFQPENAPKAFGGRAAPEPAAGAYNTFPDLLAGLISGAGTGEEGRGKDMRGWTAEGGGQSKEGRAGGRREEGRKRGGEISPPTCISKSRRLC